MSQSNRNRARASKRPQKKSSTNSTGAQNLLKNTDPEKRKKLAQAFRKAFGG